jgi:hypothetical protein
MDNKMKKLISVLLSLLLLPVIVSAQQIGRNSPSITVESADAGGNVSLLTHGTGGTVNFYTSDTLRAQVTDSGIISSTSIGFAAAQVETVSAAGNSQGTATALSATKFIHVVNASDNTTAVLLPLCVVGQSHRMLNTVQAKLLNVYPGTGAAINGGSANAVFAAGITTAGHGPTECYCTALLTWVCG